MRSCFIALFPGYPVDWDIKIYSRNSIQNSSLSVFYTYILISISDFDEYILLCDLSNRTFMKASVLILCKKNLLEFVFRSLKCKSPQFCQFCRFFTISTLLYCIEMTVSKSKLRYMAIEKCFQYLPVYCTESHRPPWSSLLGDCVSVILLSTLLML